jgi:hypothetical protein
LADLARTVLNGATRHGRVLPAMRVSDKAGADKTSGDNLISTTISGPQLGKTLQLKLHVSRRGDSLG